VCGLVQFCRSLKSCAGWCYAMMHVCPGCVLNKAGFQRAPLKDMDNVTILAFITTRLPKLLMLGSSNQQRFNGGVPACSKKSLYRGRKHDPEIEFNRQCNRLNMLTSSPIPHLTGADSPVSMLWSRREVPAVTNPSRGNLSPGRTSSRAPTATSSTGTLAPAGKCCSNNHIAFCNTPHYVTLLGTQYSAFSNRSARVWDS
jgi:hypothetical protein